MADRVILGGTIDDDVLNGGDGDDFIFGNGGADIMSGGNGNDYISSGTIYRAGGNLPDNKGDVLRGGAGADIMFGGDANDKLEGGGGNDQLNGGAGNDWLSGDAGDDALLGGAGVDTAFFAGVRADYTVARPSPGALPVAVTAQGQGTDTLDSVERLHFSDVSVAYDLDGNAGKMFRLYQAIFNRAPDKEGLGWWIDAADRGTDWLNMASGFTHSAEFDRLYGVNASNEVFLTAVYQNALHRAPDAEGFAWWLNVLNTGTSRESVLLGFAESLENQAQVIGSISGGIEYQLWLG